MFNSTILSDKDYDIFRSFVSDSDRRLSPDLEIADGDDGVYLYRWHLVPRNSYGNVYLHVQTASDPARPLHDHPWDNISIILAGGYEEIMPHWTDESRGRETFSLLRQTGEVIKRKAANKHRLVLPANQPYSMSLFVTGPVIREWGFRCADGWKPYHECTVLKDNKTYWKAGVE